MSLLEPPRKRSKWSQDEEPEALSSSSHSERVAKPKSPTSKRVRRPTSTSVYVPPRTTHPPIIPSRSVYSYERLNMIEEGSYGIVYRARDKHTGTIVALKKLKLDEEKGGFPITALREINSLMSCRHENVVPVREVVVGDTLTQWDQVFSLKSVQHSFL